MEAVVIAAGEGRRMRPLTERWAKPVLPIDGRPVIGTLAHELASSGLTRVTVVTGHLAAQVENLLGDGTAFGLELRYARQPSPDGSADAVRHAFAAGVKPPVVVSSADTVYTPCDLGRFAKAFAASGAVAAVSLTLDPPPSPGKPPVEVEAGRVVRVPGERGPYAGGPLWGLTDAVRPLLDELDGPPYELAPAVQRAIADGAEVAGIPIARTRDLTDPLDLVKENFGYLR